jgi:hypothetical protein
VKVAILLGELGGGPESITVSGAVASTVNERDAGVDSTFPAGSVARTWKV